MTRAEQILPETLRQLHPTQLSEPDEVAAVLERLQRERVRLVSGMNRHVEPETGFLAEIAPRSLAVEMRGFESREGEVFFNFELDGRPYFFSTHLMSTSAGASGWTKLTVARPAEVFLKERRGRLRRTDRVSSQPEWRVLVTGLPDPAEGRVVDLSETGIGLEF